ncbi:MAG: hypothetical protein JW891_14920 [Candidatus Lokiarchaeota archaeon]|nr:hypothetical protein [Candidatus Lokiarchaeota archaeon]
MENILNTLDLSKEAINLYLNISGKIPLSREDIIENNPDITRENIIKIINQLLEAKLLTNVVPNNRDTVPRYLPLPPFAAIYKMYGNVEKEDTKTYKEVGTKIESIVSEILEESSKAVGLDSIINELTSLRDNFDTESSEIRNEVQEVMNEMQTRDDSSLFYLNFEDALKEIIHSKFANILEIILQIESVEEKFKPEFLDQKQWNQIKSYFKNLLAQNIHKKTLELDTKISEKFTELKNYFASKLAISMEEQFGQNVVNLGILRIVIDEINQLLEKLKNKKDSEIKSSKVKELTRKKIFLELNIFNKQFIQSIKQVEAFLPEIIENYFRIDEIWQISNTGSIREEISKIANNSLENAIIIIPKISEFLDLNILRERKNKNLLKIISSDSHDSEIVKELKTYPSIEFLQIEKNKTILIKGKGILIIGFSKLEENEFKKSIRAFGIISDDFIELLNPIAKILEEQGKPSINVQINKNFDRMIENIHNFKGKKLGKLLQTNLDILSKIKGISLKLLELKLLISKLKIINVPLDEEFKNNLLEKIQIWNNEFTGLPLSSMSNKIQAESDKNVIVEDLTKVDAIPFFKEKEEEFGKLDIEKVVPLFDILLEEVSNSKAIDLSNQIQNAINTLIQIHGFSIITTWKDELRAPENADKILEPPFQEKLKEDLNRWKEEILKQKSVSIPISKEKNLIPKEKQAQEIDLGDYVSPGLMQSQSEDAQEQDANIGLSEENPQKSNNELLKEYFEQLTSQVDTLSGIEISNILQDLGDSLVEEYGYMATKEIRLLISKVKIFRGPIEEDIKKIFLDEITKLKQKYVENDNDDLVGDYQPSFTMMDTELEPIITPEREEGGSELSALFSKVLEDVQNVDASQLTDTLQEIADIIMLTKGSLSARSIRPWISKLRAIRERLDEETKAQFIEEFSQMKEKFCE